MSQNYNLIVGTYTNSGKSEGIYVHNFNIKTGENSLKSKVAGIENPSYLTISHDHKHVYSVSEVPNGSVSSYSFNSKSGELVFLNRVSSGGDGPCYVSTDDKGKYLFAANYSSGSLAAIRLNDDGSLSSDNRYIGQEGSSIDKKRQTGPHIHATVLSPDNRYLFTPNLGTDKVAIYRFDPSATPNPLVPAEPAFTDVEAGSGPRHFTFHPNTRFAYLIQELKALITVYDYEDGKLTYKQSVTMLSPGFKGAVGAADIHVSPDGRFLYGSNRGEANEIVIYSISSDGKLKYAGRQSTLGKSPRNFVIDPAGNFLLVANQNSDEIIIFKRDKKTGLLAPTGKSIQVSRPVCLKFVSVN